MIEKSVSNVHPSAQRDLTQSTWSTSSVTQIGGSTVKTMVLKRHYKNTSIITYHHISSHPSSRHSRHPPISRQRPLESLSAVKPSRTLHGAGSHHTTITRATWATSGQKPVLTQDDPGTFMASWERLKTQLNQLTWVHSCRSPQGVHSIQMYTAYKDNMKGACQRLTLLG